MSLTITAADVSRCADSAVTTCSREWRCIVRLAFVYSPVWNGFLAFVKWNGGVALGTFPLHCATVAKQRTIQAINQIT